MLRPSLAFALVLAAASPAAAHDLEKTQVSIVFAPDGSFTVDVANDAKWLAERLASVGGASFADRVVLWADGHEIRPASVERLERGALAVHRLRGRLPADAHTLRWYYGLVIDPYPLTIRRADGRIQTEEVGGDAWSRTIDVSGQVQGLRLVDRLVPVGIVAVFLVPLALRFGRHNLMRAG